LTVLIDPGHGGIDPGAIVGDVNEAGLMLSLAKELKESLLRVEGVDVVLSRIEDKFVPLEARVSLAQAVKADLIISLHADALVEGTAYGTTVYTLPARASESASQSLVLRHEPDSVLQGVDLNAIDEDVAMALLDLSRLENMQSSEILAESVVKGLSRVLGGLNAKPLRKAGFSVLKGADIPAILIEAGFMSTETDLANLQNAEWRARFAEGVRLGVMIWYAQEKQMAPLRRQ
jgi:N-acetylmuramoyl-L-alanine amidase